MSWCPGGGDGLPGPGCCSPPPLEPGLDGGGSGHNSMSTCYMSNYNIKHVYYILKYS